MPSLGVRATKMPPERPRPTRIRCAADSSRSASRIVGRLTPNSSASSCSVPIRSPGRELLLLQPDADLRRDLLAGAGRVVQDLAAGPWAYRRHARRIRDRKSPNVLQYSSAVTSEHTVRDRDVRRAAPPRADDDLLEPRLDRGAVPRRAARRPAVRARAARGLGGRDGRRPRDRPRRARRSRCCTRRPGSATPSPRSPPRARTARRSWSSSASRTAATSRSTRSWPARLRGPGGRLPGLGDQPARAAGRARERSSAPTTRPPPAAGPAIVIVPMDDWARARARSRTRRSGPRACCARRRPTRRRRRARRPARRAPSAPAIVAGAGADGDEGWAALIALAERLGCPVWQEPFGGQAGFPQDHPQFAGHLPARRARLRETLAPHDAVLVVGTGALRQYPYDAGPLVEPTARGSRSSPRTRRRRTAARPSSPCSASPAAICAALAAAVDARGPPPTARHASAPRRPSRPPTASRCAPATSSPRWRSGCRATRSCSRRRRRAAPSCTRASPPPRRSASSARWGCSASRSRRRSACGWRGPDRPVLTVVGDGSSLYQIQALWSAASYGAGVLFIVLRNGGYAIMDRLAERNGSAGPWPRAGRRSTSRAMARAQGCEARRIETHDELLERLDALLAGARRSHARRCCSRSSSLRTRRSTPDSSPRAPRGCAARRRRARPTTRPW